MTDKGKKLLAYFLSHGAKRTDRLGSWLEWIKDGEFDKALEEKSK
jgi:hypothetical protein